MRFYFYVDNSDEAREDPSPVDSNRFDFSHLKVECSREVVQVSCDSRA